LSKLDLPTFERPMNAISGKLGRGIEAGVAALAMNFALIAFMYLTIQHVACLIRHDWRLPQRCFHFVCGDEWIRQAL
jgi:hypothetical protein